MSESTFRQQTRSANGIFMSIRGFLKPILPNNDRYVDMRLRSLLNLEESGTL